MKSSKYSFPWKSSLIRGIFLLLKNFLIIASKLLTFLLYELIYMLFGKNKLVWKLQFRYIGLLVEISVSPVFYCYFYYFDSFHKHCFSLGCDFDSLGGCLMVTAYYLVVTVGYCSLPGGYWWLLLVTVCSQF